MPDLSLLHDKLFRAMLSDPERLTSFVRGALPDEITSILSDESPQLEEGSFVEEEFADRQCDALLRVRLKSGKQAFLYCLIELKSDVDPILLLNLASYMLRIWKWYADGLNEPIQALPAILPVVLYFGQSEWSVPRTLGEMIDADDAFKILPGQGYVLSRFQ